MNKKIFIGLAVKELQRSISFFTSLGYKFNPDFTDDSATCMIVSDDIFVMIHTEERFKTFIPHSLCDPKEATEMTLCLSCESKEEVDQTVRRAVDAGGKSYRDPKEYGFMYWHAFQDPDGHIWELAHLASMPPKQE